MRILLSIICLTLLCTLSVQAQELNAQVAVQAQQVQNADPRIFQTLENDLREFLNDRKWTKDNFKTDERIECSFLIIITEELSPTQFKAMITVQSSRPVYNTSYKTVLFNHQDKEINFEYAEFQPLEYNENAHLSELTSVLAYYAYLILGFDYDSFGHKSGQPYFLKAQTVVSNAQSSKVKGWKAFDSNRNRYWLAEQMLDNKHQPLRQAYYKYHRLGLDKMFEDLNNGRAAVSNALALIETTHNNNNKSMAVDAFVSAKSEEIINVFGSASVMPPTKMQVMNTMVRLDPSNTQEYAKMNNSVKNMPNGNGFNNPNMGGSKGNTVPLRGGK